MKKTLRFSHLLVSKVCVMSLMTCGWAQFPDPYASYEFNGNAIDSSTNGFNGTVNGATSATNRFGQPNSALSFTAPDSVVLPIAFGSINNLTFSMWLMRPQAWYSYTVFNDGSFRGFGVKWWNDDPSNQIFEIFAGDGSTWYETLYSTNVPNSEWINLIGTIDETGLIKQYVNGSLVASTNMPSSIAWSGVDTVVTFNSAIVTPPSGALGSIDQLQFYDTAFTTQQVSDLYNAQVVPEPSTYALLLLSGAASLWALRRRKS